jgi:hypothetical protein
LVTSAHQVDVVGRVAELGILGLGDHLFVGLFGAGDVAGGQRHVAEVAQPAHHVRRQRHRIFQHLLGVGVAVLLAQQLASRS